jgi:predicted PolB exonuclease-like 3'-5' exonuclease
MKLFLDIETLPAPEEYRQTLKRMYDKKNKKDDDFQEYFLKTSFDGAYGRILCIGYAVDDDEVKVLYNENDEKKTLEQFWNLAQYADLFIGHNVMDFDLRFIFQRSIINNVRPPQNLLNLSFVRYRNNPIFDTMKEWVKWSNNSVSLEHLALALGVPSPKDDIDGSQVWDFYQIGKVNDILEYCKKDVETARAVYKKMIFES